MLGNPHSTTRPVYSVTVVDRQTDERPDSLLTTVDQQFINLESVEDGKASPRRAEFGRRQRESNGARVGHVSAALLTARNSAARTTVVPLFHPPVLPHPRRWGSSKMSSRSGPAGARSFSWDFVTSPLRRDCLGSASPAATGLRPIHGGDPPGAKESFQEGPLWERQNSHEVPRPSPGRHRNR